MLQIVSESNNSGCNPDINPYVVYEGVRVYSDISETKFVSTGIASYDFFTLQKAKASFILKEQAF